MTFAFEIDGRWDAGELKRYILGWRIDKRDGNALMDRNGNRLALQRYANRGARAQPPVFVGREAIIEDIADAARNVHEIWSEGGVDAKDPGLTRLVQGAPGVASVRLAEWESIGKRQLSDRLQVPRSPHQLWWQITWGRLFRFGADGCGRFRLFAHLAAS